MVLPKIVTALSTAFKIETANKFDVESKLCPQISEILSSIDVDDSPMIS